MAKGLDLACGVVHAWVRQAVVDDGRGAVGTLNSLEKEEISQRRREVKVLRVEREILKRAATFLGKENA